MFSLDFGNATTLSTEKLEAMCRAAVSGWSVGEITARVRYSRGADFSGTCIYVDRMIYVNIGRHVRYPYAMKTNLARVQSHPGGWRRELYTIGLRDAYQMAMFIFLHELYHLLVYRSGRNTRQKESMCDRFAARYLVDRFACRVTHEDGRLVAREDWDFQDLNGFVAGARSERICSVMPLRKAVLVRRRRRARPRALAGARRR